MNAEATVLLHRDSRGVATMTLNRPQRRNAFDDRVIADLHYKARDLAQDATIRVVVLTGAGDIFCAGMDLDHMRRQGTRSQADNVQDALAFAHCLESLSSMNKPVIARVNGGAYGGGIGLIAAADIAIGVDHAKFALTEVRLGIVPAVIAPYVVAAIGHRQAKRLFLSAMTFDARFAQSLGLLHETVAAAELDTAVEQEIARLLQGGPHALAAAKQLAVDAAARVCTNEQTARLLAELRASPEGQEGLAAFNEKRRPNWSAS